MNPDGDPQLREWIDGLGWELNGIPDQAETNDFNPPSPGSRPPSVASSYGSIASGVSHPPRAGTKRKKRVDITWGAFDGFGKDGDEFEARKRARKEEPDVNLLVQSTYQGPGFSYNKEHIESDVKRFACPFYKRYPQEFKEHKACAGPGWEIASEVMSHILRRHKPSSELQCHRCYNEFATETALYDHQRAYNPCEKKPVSNKIDVQQERRLRSISLLYNKEEKLWNAMYKIIFPDVKVIPSPYYEPPDFPAYHRNLLMNQLPSVVHREMRKSMDGLLSPQYFLFVDRIEACVTTALKECLPAMDEAYEKEDSK